MILPCVYSFSGSNRNCQLSLALEGDVKFMHAATPTPVTNHNQANVDL